MIKVHWPSRTRSRSMFLSFKRVDQAHAFYDSQETVLNDLCCTACRCFIRCDHRHSDCAGCLAWRRLFFGKRWWFQRMGFRTWILATDLNRVALQLFALIECWSHARSCRDASYSQILQNIQIITKRYLSHHGRSYALVSLEIRYWSWHQRINHHQPLTYRLRMCCILAPIFGLAVPRWLLRKRANWPGVKHWWQGDGGRWWLASWFWTKRCLGDGVGGFDNARVVLNLVWVVVGREHAEPHDDCSLSPHVQDFAIW